MTLDSRLKRHVYTLAGEIGERNVFSPKALQRAADYIADEWTQQGYEVQSQAYQVQDILCKNLQATCHGARQPDEFILLGAHYDSIFGSPGANDNGTGVAALLELSRLFVHNTPACSLRFVAFVNEEPPFFMGQEMGSLNYARAARRRGDKIRFMVSLETIGYYRDEAGSQNYPPFYRFFYPDRGNFIAFVSNFRSSAIMREAVRAFRAHSDFPLQHAISVSIVPGVAWSDHYAFWRQGYRAFMVTDTALFRYPYYHTAQDTPEKIDYASFAAVTEGLYRTFASMAGADSRSR